MLISLFMWLSWGTGHADRPVELQGGSNITGTDFFFLTLITQHLLALVSLQRTPLTIFPFWKHPDALLKKGLWLVAYPKQSG
jgi:hypothetical protein